MRLEAIGRFQDDEINEKWSRQSLYASSEKIHRNWAGGIVVVSPVTWARALSQELGAAALGFVTLSAEQAMDNP